MVQTPKKTFKVFLASDPHNLYYEDLRRRDSLNIGNEL